MATPVYNNAGQTSSNTSPLTSLTLASFAANAGTNRFLEVWLIVGATSPTDCTGVTWGGQALTLRGSHATYQTYFRMSKWYLREADFPGGAAGDIVASFAEGGNDERGMVVMVHSDVNQAAPYRNGAQTVEEFNSSDHDPSTDTASHADDVVTGALSLGGAPNTITTTTGAQRATTTTTPMGYENIACSTVPGAATATITWHVDGAAHVTGYSMCDSLQGAAAEEEGESFDPIPIPEPLPSAFGVYKSARARAG